MKAKTIIFLEEITGKYLLDLEVSKDVSKQDPKGTNHKIKSDKPHFIKIKNFCSPKYTIKKTHRL